MDVVRAAESEGVYSGKNTASINYLDVNNGLKFETGIYL